MIIFNSTNMIDTYQNGICIRTNVSWFIHMYVMTQLNRGQWPTSVFLFKRNFSAHNSSFRRKLWRFL